MWNIYGLGREASREDGTLAVLKHSEEGAGMQTHTHQADSRRHPTPGHRQNRQSCSKHRRMEEGDHSSGNTSRSMMVMIG